MWQNKYLVCFGVLAMVFTNGSEVLTPKFIQWCLDIVTTSNDDLLIPSFLKFPTRLESMNHLLFLFMLTLLVGAFGRFLWRQTLGRLSHVVARDFKWQAWSSFKSLRLTRNARSHSFTLGDIMSRFNGDINAARFIHGFTIVTTIDVVFLFVFSIVLMAKTDPYLTSATLIPIPFLSWILYKIALRQGRCYLLAQDSLASLSEGITQSLRSILSTKSANDSSPWIRYLNQLSKDYSQKKYNLLKETIRVYPLINLPLLWAYGCLLTYGIYRVRNGTLTIGSFVAFQSYLILLQSPLTELCDVISEWQRGWGGLKRLAEIFDSSSHPSSSSPKNQPLWQSRGPFAVEINHFTYVFQGSDAAILDRINFHLPIGGSVGILGPSGSGKSTLFKIMCGELPIKEQGKILLFNTDISQVQPEWYPSNLGVLVSTCFFILRNYPPKSSARGRF